MSDTNSSGVMATIYADERKKKKELIFRYKTRAQIIANNVETYLPETANLKFLDFGSADGLTLLHLDTLISKSATFQGIEYSDELLGAQVTLPENINILKGDVTNLPEQLANESFDTVSALALLEHLPDPGACVKQAANKLRSGGIFIATCPNPFWDTVATKLGLLRGGHHESDLNKETFQQIVEGAGLNFISYQPFMWAPVSFLPYLGIPVCPMTSLKIDAFIRKLWIFNWLFVNQCIVAQKP